MMRLADRLTAANASLSRRLSAIFRERIPINPVLVPRNFAEPAKSNNGKYNLLYHGRLDLFQKQ